MFFKVFVFLCAAVAYTSANCLHCICEVESGCKAIGCKMDVGSLSCGYYQIKIGYYEDCGEPGKQSGESTETAWKRCADDLDCATKCVENYYNRYKHECSGTGQGSCEVMARNHNGGPKGCKYASTASYWEKVKSCCGCS